MPIIFGETRLLERQMEAPSAGESENTVNTVVVASRKKEIEDKKPEQWRVPPGFLESVQEKFNQRWPNDQHSIETAGDPNTYILKVNGRSAQQILDAAMHNGLIAPGSTVKSTNGMVLLQITGWKEGKGYVGPWFDEHMTTVGDSIRQKLLAIDQSNTLEPTEKKNEYLLTVHGAKRKQVLEKARRNGLINPDAVLSDDENTPILIRVSKWEEGVGYIGMWFNRKVYDATAQARTLFNDGNVATENAPKLVTLLSEMQGIAAKDMDTCPTIVRFAKELLANERFQNELKKRESELKEVRTELRMIKLHYERDALPTEPTSSDRTKSLTKPPERLEETNEQAIARLMKEFRRLFNDGNIMKENAPKLVAVLQEIKGIAARDLDTWPTVVAFAEELLANTKFQKAAESDENLDKVEVQLRVIRSNCSPYSY